MAAPVSIQRLTKRGQFLFVRAGLRQARPSLIVEARRRAEDGPAGLGFTASRKVGGAVIRNRARRRLKEAARRLLPELARPAWTMWLWRGNPPLPPRGPPCLTISEPR